MKKREIEILDNIVHFTTDIICDYLLKENHENLFVENTLIKEKLIIKSFYSLDVYWKAIFACNFRENEINRHLIQMYENYEINSVSSIIDPEWLLIYLEEKTTFEINGFYPDSWYDKPFFGWDQILEIEYLPAFFSNFKNLKNFRMHNVDVKDFSNILLFKNLENFEFNGYFNKDLKLVFQLENLHDLSISFFDTFDFFEELNFEKLKKIEKITLRECYFNSMKGLKKCSNLKSICLISNEDGPPLNLSSLFDLNGLESLEEFHVESDRITTGFLSGMNFSKRIKKISLSTNYFLDLAIINSKKFHNLIKLEELSINGFVFSDIDGLKLNSNLKKLSISVDSRTVDLLALKFLRKLRYITITLLNEVDGVIGYKKIFESFVESIGYIQNAPDLSFLGYLEKLKQIQIMVYRLTKKNAVYLTSLSLRKLEKIHIITSENDKDSDSINHLKIESEKRHFELKLTFETNLYFLERGTIRD